MSRRKDMNDPFAPHVTTDMREKTLGIKVPLQFGGRKQCTFQMGKPKAYETYEGQFMVTGEIVTASGHRFHALLEISALDSGEHFGTGVVWEDKQGRKGLAFQGDSDFKAFIADMQAQDPDFRAFPYSYRYYSAVGHDHHIDPDTGWSDTWESLQQKDKTMNQSPD